jgi:hypothetical protein
MFARFEIGTVDLKPYRALPFTPAYHKDADVQAQYVKAGHELSRMKTHHCFEHLGVPQSALDIRDRFGWLEHRAVAVNLMLPGDYLPLHGDLYGAYRSLKNLQDRIIERWIVMLHDSSPGQIIQIGDDVCAKWRAGDSFGWRNDDLHAAYNFSLQPRYALQVTGVMS